MLRHRCHHEASRSLGCFNWPVSSKNGSMHSSKGGLRHGQAGNRTNVVKTIINHPMFDGLYHPFMVILGMDYDFFQPQGI